MYICIICLFPYRYSAGSGIIGYKDGVEGYSDEARQKPVSDLDPAHEPPLDWRSADTQAFPNKIYAIGAVTHSSMNIFFALV